MGRKRPRRYAFPECAKRPIDLDLELAGHPPTWRRLVLDACREREVADELPEPESEDLGEWGILIECLQAGVLWDDDWKDSETHLDTDPEASRRVKKLMRIDEDARFTSCPGCGEKTKQKKLPLAIHVDDGGMVVLNKTCRYCPNCDLLIAHQDGIEAQLAAIFTERAPEVVGNDYLVVGTFDRGDWQRGRRAVLRNDEMLNALHDFKDVVKYKPSPGWVPPK